ncbi:UNVERIFIED_CONTAM: Serine/threonine-protein kinase KIPK2 [Sesamum radiatum]|uniref:Serine/threonine-protein kinase KIPK2 n=1 Tax=Sesamum radiatum TaxID=300843 RepID=A0AAW2KUH7_SESRA
MGSSRGNCEIVEVKYEASTVQRPQTFRHVRAQDREQRPPVMKKTHNKALENDINKLFEAVNLRTSKSLDLSDSWRNASKKPMKSAGSHSPGIGFSEPVSLKQALRGLCISQAAEMAAVKCRCQHLRISESGNHNL